MNRHHHDKEPRRDAKRTDLLAALRQVLLAPRTDVRAENREPTKPELQRRYRLDKRESE